MPASVPSGILKVTHPTVWLLTYLLTYIAPTSQTDIIIIIIYLFIYLFIIAVVRRVHTKKINIKSAQLHRGHPLGETENRRDRKQSGI